MNKTQSKTNPRKVFISILGTSFYNECVYTSKMDNFECSTRFIQEATIKYLLESPKRILKRSAKEKIHPYQAQRLAEQAKWTEKDCVIICTTKGERGSKELNWNKTISERFYPRTKKMEPYQGLEAVLENLHLPMKWRKLDIENGNSQDEIWSIFSTIYDELEEGDQLYIDLTHSFRYLPMLLLVLCSYAKFLKDVTVKSITYGNYEGRKISEDGDSTKDKAPIMELTSIAQLQDLTIGTADFSSYGKVDKLNEYIENLKDSELSGKTKSERRLGDNLQKFTNAISSFEDDLSTCRLEKIIEGKNLQQAQDNLNACYNVSFLKAATPVIDKLKESIQNFKANDCRNIREAVELCHKYHLIQQGFTLCQEGVITILCQRFESYQLLIQGIKEQTQALNYRDFWSSLLGISNDKLQDDTEWTGILKKNDAIVHTFLKTTWLNNLNKTYQKYTGYRNQLDHADGGDNYDTFEKRLRNYIDEIFPLLTDDKLTFPTDMTSLNDAEKEKLFLNLTNHPSSKWDSRQLETAKNYGTIEDIKFPNINPDWTDEQVENEAEEVARNIMEKAKERKVTVHVMGEMGFTYALVRILQKEDIPCVYSTTERKVTENPDDTETKKFVFKQFRKYTL